MRTSLSLGLVSVLIAAGCPLDPGLVPQAAVTARITASSVSGPAPLPVFVSAASSSSRNGPITSVHWDFAGQAQADTVEAVHTFPDPGRYTITLAVTDSSGQRASTNVDVRVQGGTATAVIQADTQSGPAPLTVEFDGTASGAADDSILDYFWDFGDGEAARTATPRHTFTIPGTYTVQLRVVTFGGVEATTTSSIVVEQGAGGGGASLQFNGSQFATLPVSVEAALSAFTFELWFKAEAGGGSLLSLGSPSVTLEVLPATQTLRLRRGDQTIEAVAVGLAGAWRLITVSYDASGLTSLAMDGVEVASGELSGEVAVTHLIVGSGFRGKLAGLSFSGVAVDSGDDGAGDGDTDPPALQPLGNWPMNEGGGQTLDNTVSGGTPGTLGASTASEDSDPAWSGDSP